jgi:hypothetical protein
MINVYHVDGQLHFGAYTTIDENHGEQFKVASIVAIPHHGHNTIMTRNLVRCP